MNSRAKYIIFDEWLPYIFHISIGHVDEAKLHPGYKPTSAGFCEKKVGRTGVMCFGESLSLKICCKAGDEKLINDMLSFTSSAS
jgi:hypothetical protein